MTRQPRDRRTLAMDTSMTRRKKSPPRGPVDRSLRLDAPQALAILDGTLTELRCVVKPQPSEWGGTDELVHEPTHVTHYLDAYSNAFHTPANPRAMSEHWCWWTRDDRQGPDWMRCPYGKPGDMLYVQEAWAALWLGSYNEVTLPPRLMSNDSHIIYRASDSLAGSRREVRGYCYRPPQHMPSRFARIWLRVTGVRMERSEPGPWEWAASFEVASTIGRRG